MASTSAEQRPVQTVKTSQWIGLAVVYLLVPLIPLGVGWDFSWWQAWAYFVVIFAAGVGGRMWAERQHPGLQAERVKFGRTQDTKNWDKILAPLTAISVSFPLYIIAGLDHRFHWSPIFPFWLNILGILLCIFGYAFAMWALAANRFFDSTVRIQAERGHVVCDNGPYRLVRHPGYAGNILPLAGLVLALSSLWTIIPAVVALVIVVTRTVLEDRTLQEELPGYREYAQRVRYRLVPGIY